MSEPMSLVEVCDLINPDCLLKSCCTDMCIKVADYVLDILEGESYRIVYSEIINRGVKVPYFYDGNGIYRDY